METLPTATKALPGPPHRITVALIEKICSFVANGSPIARAARLANVSPDTLRRWCKLSQEPDALPIYKKLATDLHEATARFEAWHLSNIMQHAQTEWTASAWMLERKWPDRYGRRFRSDITITKKNAPRTLVLIRASVNQDGETKMLAAEKIEATDGGNPVN